MIKAPCFTELAGYCTIFPSIAGAILEDDTEKGVDGTWGCIRCHVQKAGDTDTNDSGNLMNDTKHTTENEGV